MAATIEKLDGWDGNPIPGVPAEGDIVRITYTGPSGKQVVREKIYHVNAPPPTPLRIFIHVDLEKEEVSNDGLDTVEVTMTLRADASPTSAVKTAINRAWVTFFRDQENNIYDTVKVAFVSGIATFNYMPHGKSTKIGISKRDVNTVIGGAIITLVEEPIIQVFSDYTGA